MTAFKSGTLAQATQGQQNASQNTPTVLDRDHAFDDGSKIELSALSDVQIDHLALLGKVWGFLKYHHPRVTAGEVHWDYALFQVLPDLLAASDTTRAQAILLRWIDRLGPLGPCQPCVAPPQRDVYLQPNLAWLGDTTLLSPALSQRLKGIYRQRPVQEKQFYVSMVPNVGNPKFEHELPYANMAKKADAGLHLLSVLRFWNIVEYWFPYRDIMGENWDAVLRASIPKVMLATDLIGYQREMIALIARAHDSHANLRSSIAVRPPLGTCSVPVNVRFIGDQQLVIWGDAQAAAPSDIDLKRGDIITHIDGQAVTTLVQDWSPYYPSSNDAAKLRDMASTVLLGECGTALLQIQRGARTLGVDAPRVSTRSLQWVRTHDRPGETFQMLSDEVAYLKLSSIRQVDVAGYLQAAAQTKGLVIDIRNYPSEFVVFTLGNMLVPQKRDFVRFTSADVNIPGLFAWGDSISLRAVNPRYVGKVVILVDELSQSQAEYTTMALRTVPGAVVVGSTTAGADGNYSAIPLPGGLTTGISGLGVFYPDRRPTQRIGIVPDIAMRPTVQGLRDGRDEVLETGIRQILGDRASPETIEAMARRPAL
nr:S41 family peptidase [Rhodoferax sp.]